MLPSILDSLLADGDLMIRSLRMREKTDTLYNTIYIYIYVK